MSTLPVRPHVRAGCDFRRAQNLAELRAVARRRLPAFLFEYVDGGAEDEITLAANRAAYTRIGLTPRTLAGVAARDPSISLLGRPAALPLAVSPTGFNGMLWPGADLALARAAAAAGVPFTLSMASNMKLETVASAGGRLWMQLYMTRNRDFIASLVARAQAAGFEALVLTTDVPVGGSREWDRRSYHSGMSLTWRRRLEVLRHPRWLAGFLAHGGPPPFANLEGLLPPGRIDTGTAMYHMGSQMDAGVDWDDLRWLRGLWPGKLLVKGILHPGDALRATDCGADGILLSNHGGRQLDGAVAPLAVLAETVKILAGRAEILLDGGVRRGIDALKARALGATAVSLGRPLLYGVAAAGEAGATHALTLLRGEIDRGLALLGCPATTALGPDFLYSDETGRRTAPHA
ncbi:MAG: alpha-hydroxy-acid oxidizing protein [Proteobacteria bacterium]|nr:alpha-hydroxy-acid oxidizing protein [Pseudomonadota bacterium]HQR04239.1 alpha-hydroxy acid oxidase [Rhodocyclaceae bacterium]